MKKMRFIRPIAFAIALIMAIGMLPLSAMAIETASEHSYAVVGNKLVCNCGEEHPENGLVSVNGKGYYLTDGLLTSGWVKVDGDWYYFDKTTYSSVESYNGGYVTYKFEANGKLISGKWHHSAEGSRYFYGPSYYSGTQLMDKWFEIDGKMYCFNKDGYCYKGITFVHDSDEEVYKWYNFGVDGALISEYNYTGPIWLNGSLYYPVNGVNSYGMRMVDDAYYFFSSGNARSAVKNVTRYCSVTNGLLPIGTYTFGADGKMLDQDFHIVDNTLYYYELGNICTTVDICEINGFFYAVDEDGRVIYTGLYTDENGVEYNFVRGVGEKVKKNGLIGDRFYVEDEALPAYYGLVEFEGDFYYINDGGLIARNSKVYLSKTNGLKFSNGTDVPNAYYNFDSNGKMIYTLIDTTLNGVKDDRYYIKGVPVKAYYGLVQHEGDFYYVDAGGLIVKDRRVYVGKNNGLKFHNGATIPTAYFEFDADGKMIYSLDDPRMNGLIGDRYYIQGLPVEAYYGLVEYKGDFYYVNDGGLIARNAKVYVSKTNGLKFSDGSDIPNEFFQFGADGKMIYTLVDKTLNGLIGDRYYIEGVPVKAYYGLVEHEGYFYYVNDGGLIVRDKRVYVNKTNGLKFSDGTEIPNAYFNFDAEGKMIYTLIDKTLNGVKDDRYYIEGVPVKAYYGLVEYEGNFYYVDAEGLIVKNRKVQVSKTNGLKFHNGAVIPNAEFSFDTEGKMIYSLDDPMLNGLIGDRYYIQGIPVKAYYGLVEYEGNFYYVNDGGLIVRDKRVYVSKTNGLKFSDGTEIPTAYFNFDADGKMIYTLIDKTLNGVKDDRYYIEGVPVKAYYGLVEYEGDFYYVDAGGLIVKNRKVKIAETNGLKFHNGATIPNAEFSFDAEGKMIYSLDDPMLNGLIGDRYYIQGIPVKAYYGLVEHEGNFYYIDDGGLIVRNSKVYVSKTNGLTFSDGTEIPNAYFCFDEDGKMLLF